MFLLLNAKTRFVSLGKLNFKKKLGKYFNITDNNGKILMESASKVARLNSKGRVAKFGVGAITGGIAEGIFIGDVQKAGNIF